MSEFLKGYHEVIPDIAPPNLAHDLGFTLGVFVAVGLFIVAVTLLRVFLKKVLGYNS